MTTQWEIEESAGTGGLRHEEYTWAQQMYTEEHRGARKWEQHHAHQAVHTFMWDKILKLPYPPLS